jgi:hypothetical protein
LVNADIVVAPSAKTQKLYLDKWAEFILRSFSQREVERNYKRYTKEDRPGVIVTELDWLRRAGFANVEVCWKYYGFAVYGGVKA